MIFKIGDKFSEKFHINDKIYQGFINIFNDNNPLHTNYQFANDKGFKGIVMHGNILNGFISYFIGEKLPTKDVIIHSQEIKYKNADIYYGQVKDTDDGFTMANGKGLLTKKNGNEIKGVWKKGELQ